MRERLRRALAAPEALAALSGLLAGLTHPNASLVLLLPVCLVPLMAAVRGAAPRRAALLGQLCGVAFWLTTIPWIAFTVHRFGEMPGVVALLALLVGAMFLALSSAAMAVGVALAAPETPLGTAAVWTALWVAQEGVRTYLLGGFPWALLAAPLADYPALAQSAALGGVLLTSGLVAAVNGLLFGAVVSGGRRRAAFAASAVALVLAAWLGGEARLARLDTAPGPGLPPLKVVLVQPNVSQEVRFASDERLRIYRDLFRQSEAVALAQRPGLIVWPESAVPYSWPWAPPLRDDLVAFCRRHSTAVLFNTVWSDRPDDDDAPYYNSALLVTAGGPVLPPYHKQRLVPFGEYVPLGPLLRRIRPISRAVPGAFTPGEGTTLLPLGEWRLGGAVCYEVVYPWIARAEVKAGASLLFTLTNDAWYGTAGARRQHWQAAAFRAVETGRPLLRAAVTGITGYVDAGGRSETLPVDRPGELAVTLGGEKGALRPLDPPPAQRAGDLWLLVCAAGSGAAILRRRVLQPRGPAAPASPRARGAERIVAP